MAYHKTIACLLLYFLLSWLLTLIYNLHFNSDSKHAYYVNTEAEFMLTFDSYLNQSLKSISQMKQWLHSNNISTPIFNRQTLDSSQNTLCVGVITRQREGARFYTVQTVAALLTRVKLKYQDRLSISLMDINRNSSQHADLAYLYGLIDVVQMPFSKLAYPNHTELFYRGLYFFDKIKEAYDYSRILDYFYQNKTECDYVLLLEDDSIAAYDWYDKISAILSRLESERDLVEAKWLCVKLFTSYRYFDFFTHAPTMAKTIFIIFISSLVQICLCSKFGLITLRYFKRVECILLCLNTALILLWVKSTHISPLGYGLHEYSLGFNMVANVYPRANLALLFAYFNKYIHSFARGDFTFFLPKDFLLEEVRKDHGLSEYILEPSLFQHVGLHTSINYFKWENEIELMYKNQYKPFQSYSFIKEYTKPIVFNPNY